MEGKKECRICLDSENQEHLFSPCLCKGSQSHIHEECLLSMRHSNEKYFYQCPTCKYDYKISNSFLLKFLLKEESLIIISLCFTIFIFIVIASIFKLIYFKQKINSFKCTMIFLSLFGTPCLIYYNGHYENVFSIFSIETSFIYFLYSMHVLTKKFIRKNIKFENKVEPIGSL